MPAADLKGEMAMHSLSKTVLGASLLARRW
jgi:hypothetical protein